MDFSLSSEQKEYQELALKFAKNEMIPNAAKFDESGEFPKEIFEKAWQAGLLNTCVPVEYGGAGFSNLDAVLIGECLAYGCMGMNSSMMANDLALLPIVIAGTAEQKKKFLTPFTEKFLLASFCLTEPENGSDAAGIKTSIVDKGDHYEVNGNKMWITNGGYADLYVVYGTKDASLKNKGISCVVVPKGTAGIEIGKKEDKLGHRASDTRAITFNKVKVPKENLLGKEGEGWQIAMKTLDHSRPLVAASAVGGAQRAMDLAVKYALERKQFGKSISEFQAVQFMLAEMGMRTEASRMLVYQAAWMADQKIRNTKVASIAKAMASDGLMQTATDAVQIYGGYGYSKEYPIEKIFRDAKLLQIYEGTSQIQRMVIARELLRSN
ncbi:MAG: acyl-CoA dehydrogenase family protein [Bacteriovoracaceae bacterium]|nr:acyl-CoA dehydrogenase family protein [Bacteriovoracaceae bacterium]